MKIAFHTLGCKVNQYETEALRERFAQAGFEPVDENEFADIYIINTCTVTNLADRKSRQYIRRMKRKNPESIIAVTGCYAQVKPEELMAMPEVDILAGTGEKPDLVSYIEEFLSQRVRQEHVTPYESLCEYRDSGVITSMESRTRAYIKVEEGCNRFCAYCLIPFARGRVRSRNPEEIMKEAGLLVQQGFKELILTGINTALYGTEPGFAQKYPEWQRKHPDWASHEGIETIICGLENMPGDFRVRLSSLEPAVVDAEYASRLLKYDRLCHHLHLSAQSGSDRILESMNRPYTAREYLKIVEAMRKKDPNYGITTDIIVGFPGETEEDFADTIELIKMASFGKVHGFPYSKRKGTAAAGMKGQLSPEVKAERMEALGNTADAAAESFLRGCIGDIRMVLLEEEEADGDGNFITGYTDNYIRVYVPSPEKGKPETNCFKEVKLLEIYRDGMKGELI